MKTTLCIIMVAGCGCWIWMCLLCLRVIPFSIWQLYVSTILASSLTYSASPIFFEFCVEIVYPVPEGIVGGFLTCVYNTFGMIFLFLFYIPQLGKFFQKKIIFQKNQIFEFLISANNSYWIPYAIMASTIISLPLVLLVKEEYNRTSIDIAAASPQPQTPQQESDEEQIEN